MRRTIQVTTGNSSAFIRKLINWAKLNNVFVLLNSNGYNSEGDTHDYDFIAAFGVADSITAPAKGAFSKLENFYTGKNDWIFGHLTYDLKNGLEDLTSDNQDGIHFSEMYFFQPEYVILSKNQQVEMHYLKDLSENTAQKKLDEINALSDIISPESDEDFIMESRYTRQEYINTVNQLKKHIQNGDIYEVNFCQEFYSQASIDPYHIYNQLNELSPAPFSGFYKLDDKFLVSSSPERFLKKKGQKVISQPIKGTAPRGRNEEEDRKMKQRLLEDVKERAENVMIVDLVRNDLAKAAKKDTVKVDELFGIYSFKQVHQMISTISAEIEESDAIKCLKNAFPMGSMTGAPKIRAMELIEQYENTKRGLYSGSIGYFQPNGDFDFNVIIRSILYNETQKYVSYIVGGAITYLCTPETEYDECMVKAKAMKKVLNSR